MTNETDNAETTPAAGGQNELLVSRGFTTDYERDAYSAGFDCAINGANTTNCNFVHFSSALHTAAWEIGKRDGDAERETAKELHG